MRACTVSKSKIVCVCVWGTVGKGVTFCKTKWQIDPVAATYSLAFVINLCWNNHPRTKQIQSRSQTYAKNQYQNICEKAIPLLIHPSETLPKAKVSWEMDKISAWMFLVKIMSWKRRSLMYRFTACPLHCWLRESAFKADLPLKAAHWSNVLHLFSWGENDPAGHFRGKWCVCGCACVCFPVSVHR